MCDDSFSFFFYLFIFLMLFAFTFLKDNETVGAWQSSSFVWKAEEMNRLWQLVVAKYYERSYVWVNTEQD